MCTNGMLMDRAFGRIPPSKHFAFVVHIDGMREVHDHAVDREGVFDKATAHMREAIRQGYRVCTNTTIYRGVPAEEYVRALPLPARDGRRGVHHVARLRLRVGDARPRAVPRRQGGRGALHGRPRAAATDLDIPFYNNPLFHEFLQGKREYRCSAWSMPTYTVEGWRSPCYMLADRHVTSLRELYEGTDWEAYGTGRDPRCANCKMHCGYEASTIIEALKKPKDLVALARA